MGNAGQPEQWIELKSYSAYSDTGEGRKLLAATGGQPIGQWAGGKGKNIGKIINISNIYWIASRRMKVRCDG